MGEFTTAQHYHPSRPMHPQMRRLTIAVLAVLALQLVGLRGAAADFWLDFRLEKEQEKELCNKAGNSFKCTISMLEAGSAKVEARAMYETNCVYGGGDNPNPKTCDGAMHHTAVCRLVSEKWRDDVEGVHASNCRTTHLLSACAHLAA